MKGPKTIALLPENHTSEDFTLNEIRRGLQEYVPELFTDELPWTVYSEGELERYIELENRYGTSGLHIDKLSSFGSLSSGEKRKLLFEHLLAQDPVVLILVSPLESLDPENRTYFTERLRAIKQTTWLIQVLYRPEFKLSWTEDEFYLSVQGQLIPYEDRPPTDSVRPKHLPSFGNTSSSLPGEPLIQMEGLSLLYHDRCILKDIHWQVNIGEFWELSGPNGSGKSSLISLVTGDNHKAYGQPLQLFGKQRGSGESVWDIKSNIGYFTPSQLQGFGGYQTAEALLLSGYYDSIGLYQTPSDRQQRIAKEWLDWLEIPADKKFKELSPGQQRMLMTVRACLKKPPLLLLDEPTLGLDSNQIKVFVNLINQLFVSYNCSVIYVSHLKEVGLCPTHRIHLLPSEHGSTGLCTKIEN